MSTHNRPFSRQLQLRRTVRINIPKSHVTFSTAVIAAATEEEEEEETISSAQEIETSNEPVTSPAQPYFS